MPKSRDRGRPRNLVCGRCCGSTAPDLFTWYVFPKLGLFQAMVLACNQNGTAQPDASCTQAHGIFAAQEAPRNPIPELTFVKREIELLLTRAHDTPLPERLRPVPPGHVGGGGGLGERMKQRRLLHPRVGFPESCKLRPQRCSSTRGGLHTGSRQPICSGVAVRAVHNPCQCCTPQLFQQ